MMNLMALGLLISSLAAAGVWSPPPEPPKPRHPDTVVREGHRVIVVEYERQVPSDHSPLPETTHHLFEEAKEKFQEAASHLPNVGQGLSAPTTQSQPESQSHSTKDKICDAYGSCKDKLSNLVGKGKDKVAEKAAQLEETAKDTTKKVMDKSKDITADKASELKETAKDTVKKTVESCKEAGQDMASNISSIAEKVVNETEAAAAAASDLRRNLTDITRRARDVAYDAIVYVGAPETASTAAAVAQLLGFATAYGTCVWVTFASSHVLATALPRQQFGLVQSKLYPVYFRVVAYGVGVAWLAHFLGQDRRSVAERLQGYNLLGSFVLVLVNMLFLEPKATKVMFERMKVEKEEGRGRDMADVLVEPASTTTTATTTTAATTPTSTAFGVARSTVAVDREVVKGRMVKLNERLKMLNNYSSFLNVLSLMGLTWHLAHLAHRVRTSC
ncbi:putative transmembrane protein [Cocos nucifera]|uniref:Putative transmembrane protein n=1 Tax=Cocos nucifera TaxID=13894 RepID=A0A8K0HZK6_COCNU|nr:putative transmembrane protein [Cocos nucifera]